MPLPTDSKAPGAAPAFRDIRAVEFPWTADVTYLNSAAIGPLPQRTVRALAAFDRKRERPYLMEELELLEIMSAARAVAARLINADISEIALATNTGYGLNQAAQALPLERGDVVLVPDGEFPGNVYPWMLLAERGIRVELVPPTVHGWPDEQRIADRLADPKVRVLSISLVQFANGYRADLDTLGAICRDHDVFLVVDAIQGLGQVPFDVRSTPVDILACGAQKWLLAPWGAGLFYVRRELVPELAPAFAGWMAFAGTDDFSQLTSYDPTPHRDARRYEMVTLPYQDLVAMTVSVGMLIEMGIDRIQQHTRALREPLVERAASGAFAIVSPTDTAHDSAIVCVRTDRPQVTFAALRDAKVTCAIREGNIRISPHCYNTIEELQRVADTLAR